jgi:hypothetical protein
VGHIGWPIATRKLTLQRNIKAKALERVSNLDTETTFEIQKNSIRKMTVSNRESIVNL